MTLGDTPVRRWVNPAVYVAMVLMFGSSFAVVHVALGGMTGIQVGMARILGGSAVLGVAMLVVRPTLPRGKLAYLHLSVMGLTSMFIPHFAFAIAQGDVSSGLAAIYNSAAPLVTTLLAAMFLRDEPLTPLRVVGGGLGFFSVVLLISPWDQGVGTPTIIAHLLCLLGALGFAASVLYFRMYIAPRRIDPLPSAFFAMVASLLLSLALLPFAGPAISDPAPIILFALVFLCLGPSGIGPVFNARLLRAWGPVRVSSMGYLMPVIAVMIGVLVLGETMRPTDPAAAALILVSVLLVQLRPRSVGPLDERPLPE